MSTRNAGVRRRRFLAITLSSAVAVLGLVGPGGPAHAAGCTTDPVVPADGNAGPGTFRQAVLDACAGSTVTFAFTGKIVLLQGQITIDKNLTIQGPGPKLLTVESQAPQSDTSRVFRVSPGVTAAIAGLTISGGKVLHGGGGIKNDGNLTVSNSTISGNQAVDGGGLAASGGGIATGQSLDPSQLALSDSEISGNGAYAGAGLSCSLSCSMTIIDSTISQNRSSRVGGGIFNAGALEIANSLIHQNEGFDFGGGLYNARSATVTNTTISENEAGWEPEVKTGAGIWNDRGIAGPSTLTLISSTITRNRARGELRCHPPPVPGGPSPCAYLENGYGGGLSSERPVNVRNSIIAENIGYGNSRDVVAGILTENGSLNSQGYNLIGAVGPLFVTITGDTTGNILNQNAQLGPLGFYGDPDSKACVRVGPP